MRLIAYCVLLLLTTVVRPALAIPFGPGDAYEAPYDFSQASLPLPITSIGFDLYFTGELVDPGEEFRVDFFDSDGLNFFSYSYPNVSVDLSALVTVQTLATPLTELPVGVIRVSSVGNSTFDVSTLLVRFDPLNHSFQDVTNALQKVTEVPLPNSVLLFFAAFTMLALTRNWRREEVHQT